MDLLDSVKQSLDQETLRSERRRISLLSVTVVVMILILLAITSIPALMAPELYEQISAYQLPGVTLLVGFLVYELMVRAWYGRLLARGEQPPTKFRYGNVFVEVSLPTLFLVIGMWATSPLSTLQSAAPFLYFLFIAFVALQLDFKLCVFAGFVAAIEFFAFAMLVLRDASTIEELEILTAPHQYGVKAIVILLVSIATGFVASQIRRQFIVSLQTLQERDRAIKIFGHHVSPQVAEKLLTQPLESAGETRSICAMFLDIRNFSDYAADHAPDEVVGYLNALFSPMVDIINEHNGIINKFLGDGFMAVFGAPMDDPAQCRHAVEASLHILRDLERDVRAGLIPPTRVGIGLHMGEAVTGNVGASDRKEYTIIGDTVNLAARIEQVTKHFDAQLLISEAVYQLIDSGDHAIEDLGMVELKGQPEPVRIYRLA
ncbi:MAG: adenylate/guanylate cyclase domain-containing protein [Planctomycetota bacterium]